MLAVRTTETGCVMVSISSIDNRIDMFSPIAERRFNKQLAGMNRVAVRHSGGEFVVHVDRHAVRLFTMETLPDEIKTSLAMINAFNWSFITSDEEWGVWFRVDYPKDMRDVGWRVNPNMYTVLLSDEVLARLQTSAPTKIDPPYHLIRFPDWRRHDP